MSLGHYSSRVPLVWPETAALDKLLANNTNQRTAWWRQAQHWRRQVRHYTTLRRHGLLFVSLPRLSISSPIMTPWQIHDIQRLLLFLVIALQAGSRSAAASVWWISGRTMTSLLVGAHDMGVCLAVGGTLNTCCLMGCWKRKEAFHPSWAHTNHRTSMGTTEHLSNKADKHWCYEPMDIRFYKSAKLRVSKQRVIYQSYWDFQ